MVRNVIIVSSSYGTDYIQKCGGQYNIIPIVKQSGADGIEIRRELFTDPEFSMLSALAKQIKNNQLICFYSVPFHLFIAEGKLNPNIINYLNEATELGAKLIKLSLGYYSEITKFNLIKLQTILSHYTNIQLVVENDQSECGTIPMFEVFFKHVTELSLPIKMAFDTGNWLCLNVNPNVAALLLRQYVGYIHVKAAKSLSHGKIVALPPLDLNDKWMMLINDLLPKDVARGIEFPLEGTDLVSVSKKYVCLLKS